VFIYLIDLVSLLLWYR